MFRRILIIAVIAGAAVAAMATGITSTRAAGGPYAAPGGPYAAVAGQPVQFNGTGSIGVGLSYAWNFGDGTGAVGAIVTHAYAAPGVYTVTLAVTDIFGQSSLASTTVSVGSRTVIGANGLSCAPVYGGYVCGAALATPVAYCAAGAIPAAYCLRLGIPAGVAGVVAGSTLIAPLSSGPGFGPVQLFCPTPNYSALCKVLDQ